MRKLESVVRIAAHGVLLGAVLLWFGRNAAFAQSACASGAPVPCASLAAQIEGLLGSPAVVRAHWGIAVTDVAGAPIYAMNSAQLFQPASNAKLFTTAAALALLGPETTFETRVIARGVLDSRGRLTGDLVLIGGGDANLSGRTLPYLSPAQRPKREPGAAPLLEPDPLRYLEELADQVAATGLKSVSGQIVGDDTLFPWQPYAEDWSIDDTVWGYGAPVSALTVNDNQLRVTVRPGPAVGRKPELTIFPAAPAYYTIDASSLVTSAAKTGSRIQMERSLGSKVLRVYGSIALDAAPDEEEVAIHDPAEYAALALKGLLETRGIAVAGAARPQHRTSTDAAGFMEQMARPISAFGPEQDVAAGVPQADACAAGGPEVNSKPLATHMSPPLVDDVVLTNKISQNLHAELLLQHLGHRTSCSTGGTIAGARLVRAFLKHAGVDKDDFVFFDGSGLSGHDLVTPRATAKLLQYATTQLWFADWKRSLPIGGEDGSLASRFAAPPLKDHVFAKTGTLGEARALSGYLDCTSGRTVIFSIMVGNHAPRSNADREVMDKIVAAIAAAN